MNHNDVEQLVDALKNKVQDSHAQVSEIREIAVEALDAISRIHESVEADEDLERGAHISSVNDELVDLEVMSIKMQ
mgnify:FL=1